MPRKTTEVARSLNVRYHRLMNLIRSDKIPAPRKDASGDFVWSDEDVRRAREALNAPRHKNVSTV